MSVYTSVVLPWTKKKPTVVMHHVISKKLQSDTTAMHRCVKSQQSQVAFARGSAAESSTVGPRYHKILILCISSMVLFFFFSSRVVDDILACLSCSISTTTPSNPSFSFFYSCKTCLPFLFFAQVNKDKMAAALSPDMLATDLAYYLVRKGVREGEI